MSVAPPSSQWRMWWTCSQRVRSHPGTRHPRSRSSTTMRVRSGTVRTERPTLTGLPPSSMTARTRASQLRNRRTPSARGGPRWRWPPMPSPSAWPRRGRAQCAGRGGDGRRCRRPGCGRPWPPGRRPTRPVALSPATEQGSPGLGEGPLDEGALVGRQHRRQPPGTVVVVTEDDLAGLGGRLRGRLGGLGLLGEAVAAERPPELADRGLAGQFGHLGIGGRGGVAGHDRDLVFGQLARLERGPGLGQLSQAPGHGDQRAGPATADPALPGHPLLGRADADAVPRPRRQNLADEAHQPAGGGVDDTAHLGDLALQPGGLRLALHMHSCYTNIRS